MIEMSFAGAIESALNQAMTEDENVFIMGEDVQLIRANLFVRFGKNRVKQAPISESGFLSCCDEYQILPFSRKSITNQMDI